MFHDVWVIFRRQVRWTFRATDQWAAVLAWPAIEGAVWTYVGIGGIGSDNAAFLGRVVGGFLVFQFFYHSQAGLLVMNDVNSGMIVHILSTPISLFSYLLGCQAASLFRAVVAVLISAAIVAAVVLTSPDPCVSVSGTSDVVLRALAASLFVLPFSFAVGTIVMGLSLIKGRTAQAWGWLIPYLFFPFSCLMYPLTAVPIGIRVICLLLPITYVAEIMRGPGPEFWPLAAGFCLTSVLFLLASYAWVGYAVRRAKDTGAFDHMSK